MKKRYRQNKGSALVEFIIVMPPLLFFLFAAFEVYQVQLTRIGLMKTSRYIAWEKVDTTGGTGGTDPRPSFTVLNDAYALEFHSPGTQYLGQNAPSGTASDAINGSVNGLGLNTKGLWQSKADLIHTLTSTEILNRLIPGGEPLPTQIKIEEKCFLLTDCWNSITADPQKQVKDRISGYWLAGPTPILSGTVVNFITSLLNFHISLPWPFDEDVYLCSEQPPRVNLEAVPTRD